jgi:hypothetical protein
MAYAQRTLASISCDAQRVIESIEALVRIHNAQEEDIYEHAVAA